MLECILGVFQDVVHELRVFELLRPQVSLQAVLGEKSVDCFSTMFPDGTIHVLDRHVRAVGDTLSQNRLRAVPGTGAVGVEDMFDSCSGRDDDDSLIEDLEREDVSILLRPFGEPGSMSNSMLWA